MKTISILILLTVFIGPMFPENKDFFFSSDRTSISLAKGNELTSLMGNAKISSEETKISADSIELFGDDFRFARCTGNVQVIDKKQGILITTENLFFDRKKENITIIQIGVRVLKASENDSMICRSEYAKFNRDSEILELSGMPVVFWKDDEYKATRITINLDTDDIALEGEVSGTIRSTETEEESNE